MSAQGSGGALGRGFWLLQVANAVDGVGDGALVAALPLLTASLTRDPRLVSLVSVAAYLPWLVVSLPAGALIDRSDHGRVMWVTQLGQAAVVALVTSVILVDRVSVPIVVAAAFLLGVGEVLFSNASQSVLPRLVAADDLPRANSVLYIVQTVSQTFLGPPLGGVLFAVAVALPFGLDVVSFAGSAALLALLPRRVRPSSPGPRVSLRTSIREGVQYLVGHRLLRASALLLGVNNFAGALGQATLVLFATRTLGLSPQLFGALFLGTAIGGVAGGLLVPRILRRLGELTCLILAPAVVASCYLAAGLVQNGFQLAVVLTVSGFAIVLWNVTTVSLRQRIVPPELLGRVNSAYRMLGWGLIPVGALLGGLVAAWLGLRAPLPIAGAIRLASLLIALPALIRGVRALQAALPDTRNE